MNYRILATLPFVLGGCATANPEPTASVIAALETARVAGSGDAADDPAVWNGPKPSASLLLGTDKTAGLYVYELDGRIRQFLPAGRLNNVDVWPAEPDADRDLAAATNRTNRTLDLFEIGRATGDVSAASSTPVEIPERAEPYGACVGVVGGERHAVVTSDLGEVVQYAIGLKEEVLEATEVRRLDLGSVAEGCVFDDRTQTLYVGEEMVGVWRLSADPAAGDEREMVAPIDRRRLVADVEGLTIYPQGEDGGWLVASSQGDSAYAVFTLPTMAYAGRFRILDGPVDRTTETDGIAASAVPLPGFPEGVFVAQDDADDAGGQNFKIVDWRDIAAALGL